MKVIIVLVALLSLCSCVTIPDRFFTDGMGVVQAAGKFYMDNGRWPTTKEELLTAHPPAPLAPVDWARVAVHLEPQPNGRLMVRWVERSGQGLFASVSEGRMTLEPPTTRPTTQAFKGK
jgi:hypothetical protein